MGNTRTVPPLPGHKPAVPQSFLHRLTGGNMGIPGVPGVPNLTGGAAAPATSGGVGMQGNIGDVFIKAGGKNTGFSVWTYLAAGVAFAAWLKWGRK